MFYNLGARISALSVLGAGKVVSEWRSGIAVSLNVGGGVRLIKPAKTVHVHAKHNTH